MATENLGIKASDIKFERYRFDVVVIGAGGAGLRAAVEAREAGLRVAIICKSLFGKAHTVMAEGGAAAHCVPEMDFPIIFIVYISHCCGSATFSHNRVRFTKE